MKPFPFDTTSDMPDQSMKPDAGGWAIKTMEMINDLTPDIKGKAFSPDWCLLRQRLEDAERAMQN